MDPAGAAGSPVVSRAERCRLAEILSRDPVEAGACPPDPDHWITVAVGLGLWAAATLAVAWAVRPLARRAWRWWVTQT